MRRESEKAAGVEEVSLNRKQFLWCDWVWAERLLQNGADCDMDVYDGWNIDPDMDVYDGMEYRTPYGRI